MNIHPIIIHFPIALLTLYSGMECVRLHVLQQKLWWIPLKRFLLIIGTVGGFFSLFTGESASAVYQQTSTMPLVELHAAFAQLSILIYAILSLREIIGIAQEEQWLKRFPSTQSFVSALHHTIQRFFRTPLVILLSLIAFIALSITGALGGAIVYGPDVDPIVSFFYHLFF
jgi:uncharacterized membrane protein